MQPIPGVVSYASIYPAYVPYHQQPSEAVDLTAVSDPVPPPSFLGDEEETLIKPAKTTSAAGPAPAAETAPWIPAVYRRVTQKEAKTIYSEEDMLLSGMRLAEGILGKTPQAATPQQRATKADGGYFHFHYENRPNFWSFMGARVKHCYSPKVILVVKENETKEEKAAREKEEKARQDMMIGAMIWAVATGVAIYFFAQAKNGWDDLKAHKKIEKRMSKWQEAPGQHPHVDAMRGIAKDMRKMLNGEFRSRCISLALALIGVAGGAMVFLGGKQRNFTLSEKGYWTAGASVALFAGRALYNAVRYHPQRKEAQRIFNAGQNLIANQTWIIGINNEWTARPWLVTK